MDDPLFKNKYQKHKNRVKNWEKDFQKKHNRIPSKHDIREARKDIRDAYKIYYKLKTSFLETTLSDVLSDDGFDISEYDNSQFSNTEESTLNSPSTSFTLPNDMSLLTNSFSNLSEKPLNVSGESLTTTNRYLGNENYESKEFQAIIDLEHNKNAWKIKSPENTKNNSEKEKDLKQSNELRSKLSSKLKAASGSFAKRNPRKALKKTHSVADNLTINSSITVENDSLPDFETFLLQKAKEQKSPDPITKLNKDITLVVDENWLNRLSDSPKTRNRNYSETQISHNKDITTTSYGLSNLKVPENLFKAQGEQIYQLSNNEVVLENYSDEVISNSEDDDNKIRHIRKRRKILKDVHGNQQNNNNENNNIKGISNTQISIIENNLHPHGVCNTENEPAQVKENLNNTFSETKNTSSEYNENKVASTIIKKKKILKTKGKKKIKSKSGLNESNLINDEKEDELSLANLKNRLILEQSNIASVNKNQNFDSNEDQVNSNTIKKKKVVTAKRSKAIKLKSPQSVKRSTRSSKRNNVINEDQDDDELILENLKNRLILEQDDINSNPSANKQQLANAENILKDYLNSNSIIKQKKIENVVNYKKEAAIAKLEEKVKKGKLNENFVTIDLRKKVFVRGKKTVNYSKYKKKMWRHQKKINALTGPDMDMRGCDGGVLTCFKCGKPGHFAQKCNVKGDNLLPVDVNIEDDSPFPTLAEAELSAKQKAAVVHSSNIEKLPAENSNLLNVDQIFEDDGNIEFADSISDTNDNTDIVNNSKPMYIGHEIPQDFLEKCGLLDRNDGDIGPVYPLNPDGSVQSVTSEVNEVLKMFGHSHFRKNQDKAIMRILSGLSTLVTLSTGSGKSLCYQLPAYIFSRQKKCITLVISPLVSLMEDQVHDVPAFLNAHCLHTNQTPHQRNKVMDMLNAGEIDILLVSPEAVVAGERSTGFGSLLRKLPPIAFACIDEAHCVSHWSHNFRPSYLMICKVLRKKLGVKTILGLTATATAQTRNSIMKHLGIEDGIQGVITDKPLPDNLILSVSKDSNRDNGLITLLRSERFDNCQSIIIYCTRRDECERIASYIRTCMQDKVPDLNVNTKSKRKRKNWFAEPYHAGMPASRRRTIQNAFMSNNLRIVVATVAFGMGINKSDIRAVIHYNMPKNFESYVQEVGRAGRDGKISHCHTFLNSKKGEDLIELKRHIYANSVDRHVIRKLLQNIFKKCSCNKNTVNSSSATQLTETKRKCSGHEIAFSIEDTVQALDIPEENISTLLCYLELDENYNINVLANAYTMCKVLSYGGPKYLKQAAKECPPLAMAIALGLENGTFSKENNLIEFSVVEIASAIGWNSGVVKYQLKNLEWVKVNGKSNRSTISVNLSNLGFHIKAPGDFTSEEIDEALDLLYNRTNVQEKAQLLQLQLICNALSSFAHPNCLPCCEKEYSSQNSDKLKDIIRDYFERNCNQEISIEDQIEDDAMPDEQIINDVRSLLYMYPENNFTGRSVARIFHGISSPNFPAVMWSRCKYWRAHCKSDFNKIIKLSNYVIVKMRT